MKLYKKLAFVLAGCIASVGISSTWAAYAEQHVKVNPFYTAASSALSLPEAFNPLSTLLPGETVEKKAYFKNTGGVDLVLRMKVEEYWGDGEGNPLPEEDPLPDTKMVEKKTSAPILYDGEIKNLQNDAEKKTDWVRIGEYFYYSHILKKNGEEGDRTPYFLETIKLKEEASNDEHNGAFDYSGRTYVINFQGEAVQADKVSIATSDWNGLSKATEGARLLDWYDYLPETGDSSQ